MGPAAIDKAKRDAYFKLLGIPRIPDDGDYFTPFNDFVAKERASKHTSSDSPPAKNAETPQSDDEFDLLRPWSEKQYPILARWLAANERPLSIVIKGSKFPRHFHPLVASDSEGVLDATASPIKEYRAIRDALMLRAMLSINEGKIDEAWSDLLTVHRVGRLVGQGPMILDAHVGLGLDGLACAGDQVLLQHAELSSKATEEMRNKLAKLPSLPPMADYVDAGERFMMLDAAASVARGTTTLADLAGRQSKLDATEMKKIDWDTVLKMANPWYDRMAAALRRPTRSQRKEACDKIKRDFKELVAKNSDKTSIAISAIINPRDAVSRRVGMVFLALFELDLNSFIEAEDRVAMQFELTKLGFALAAYHADHGSYPAKLAELEPHYAADIPKDVFSGRELHYKREAGDYLLYSVGSNGVDDGGKDNADHKSLEDWHDLSVRVPSPAKGR